LGGLHVAEQRQVYEDVLRAFERWAPDVTRPEVAAQLANVRAEKDFETGLQQATPHAWGMASMVALCIGVWAGGVLTGVNAWKPDIDALLHWGGNATSLVQGGEWWRLGSGMFMHGGIVHLALNMIVLWITGRLLTRWFGNSGFLLVYLGSGLVGSALSLHFAAQLHVVVGASGAVFGVLGAVLVCLLLHRDRFPIRDSKRLLVSMASFAVYSLVQGFVQPGIDNAGHVGGLLAGVVLGRLLIAKFDTAAAPTARWRRWGLGAAGCLAAIVVVGVTAPPAARDMATFRGNIQVMQAVMSEIGDKAKAMQQRQPEMRRNMEMGRMSAAQFAQQILQGPGRSMRQGADRLAALNWGRDDPFGRYAQAQAANLIATADLIDFNIQVASGGNALTGEVKQKEAALTAKVRATQQTVIDQTKQLLSEAQLQALPAAEQQALHVTPAANAR
jgi:rhomboid protease GluP